MTDSDTLRFNPMDVPVSGTIELRGSKRRVWYVRWRDHTGQHRRRLGPAWEHKGPPDPGYYREREAQAALQAILTDARRGVTQQGRTGLTFAVLADEWLDAGVSHRDWSYNTEVDYRSVLRCHLLPAFGDLRVEAVSASRIEKWRNELVQRARACPAQRQQDPRHPRQHPRVRARAPRATRESRRPGAQAA